MVSSQNTANGSKRLVIGGLTLLLIMLALILASTVFVQPSIKKGPQIGLMTSLPLRWPELDNAKLFDANAEPSQAFQRLEQQQPVVLLDDFKTLSRFRVILLAQSRALSPAEFVALDDWVRGGGRALILADPALAWESNFPVGDRRRPLFTSLHSPLFGHWGLKLVLDIDAESRDVVQTVRDSAIKTQTFGKWLSEPKDASARCKLDEKRVLADCRIGKGRAYLIADADLLNDANWQGSGIRALFGWDDFGNLALMQKLIDELQQ
jgi:hypothetical protein